MHDLLGPREPAEVTVNDNAVEAVVDEGQQIAKQLGERDRLLCLSRGADHLDALAAFRYHIMVGAQ